jgi:hypothetical protein
LRALEIGFVWLQVAGARRRSCFHKPLYERSLCSLSLLDIGFVFSNCALSNAVVSDFELRASDFRPKTGILALFFQIAPIQLVSDFVFRASDFRPFCL